MTQGINLICLLGLCLLFIYALWEFCHFVTVLIYDNLCSIEMLNFLLDIISSLSCLNSLRSSKIVVDELLENKSQHLKSYFYAR